MRALVVIIATVLVIQATPAGADGDRTAVQPYVASWLNTCPTADPVDLANGLGAEVETFGQAVIGSIMPSTPQVPGDPAPPSVEHSACFQILPGEAQVTLDVVDALNPVVAYWYGFTPNGPDMVSGIRCSNDASPLDVPTGATTLQVTVYQASAQADCLGATGSSGMVRATFT